MEQSYTGEIEGEGLRMGQPLGGIALRTIYTIKESVNECGGSSLGDSLSKFS
jgi:rRNA maturation protein Nop10